MTIKTKTLTRRVVDTSALYQTIGKRIRAAREDKGLSQAEIGLALGMTRANVANLEAGKTRILLEHIYNVALLLNQPVQGLLP